MGGMFSQHAAGPTLALIGVATLVGAACGGISPSRGDAAFSRESVPIELREEYDLFAARCSKCHSLARPLEIGIARSDPWRPLVERMRREPGSGVSQSDAPAIAHFLDWYSAGPGQRPEPGSLVFFAR
jgi:hypothetical protein